MSESRFHERPPIAALKPAIDAIWGHRSGDRAGPSRVLPDGCMDLLLRRPLDARGEPAGPWKAQVVGAMTRALLTAGAAELLGVRFRPGEAWRFLEFPAQEATDLVIELGAIDHLLARETEERLARATGFAAQAAAVEAALLGRLTALRPADFRLRRAIAALTESPCPVGQLAREVGLGERQLHRLCLQRVGLGPAMLGRVLRLQRAVRLAEGPVAPGWSRVATAAGYFDQPHLNREFRDLVGLSPASYTRERGRSDLSKPAGDDEATGAP